MLKWLRSIDWVAINTSALILIVSLWVVSATLPYQIHQSKYGGAYSEGCKEHVQGEPLEPFWQRTKCDPTAFFTLWLTIFSGLLGATAVVQIFLLFKADANAASATEIARQQVIIQTSQTAILTKQEEIARQQFLNEHRPRLKVRHVSVVTAEHIGHPTIFFIHGARIRGRLVVVNVGGSKARIIDSFYRIHFSKTGLPVFSPLEDRGHVLLAPEQVLEIGQSLEVPITDTIEMNPRDEIDKDAMQLRQFDTEGWEIFVMGQIQYQDEAGHDRFFGFCRKRERDGRFGAVDDPDYEYED
jgi:hypothetical protein